MICGFLRRRRLLRQWYTCPTCGNQQDVRGFCANDQCPDPRSIVLPD